MIDKEKLNEIAIYYSTILMRAEEHDSKPFYQKGFKEGAYWMIGEFLKENMFYKAKDKRIQGILELGYARITNKFLESLWHDASEEPEENREFLYQEENDTCHVMILPGSDWKLCVFLFGIIRWCYIDDLLPEEGGEG